MSSTLRWFSAFALVAIIVPAVVVAVLGYVSLRQLETSAELLFREQARDVVSMAAEKIEMVVRRVEDDLLGRLEAALAESDGSPRRLERFLGETPLIQRLYLFDRRGQLLYPAQRQAEDPVAFEDFLAEISPGFWERGERRDLVVGDRLVLAAVVRAGDGTPRLAAITRSVEGLRRELFATTLDGLEAPTNIAVLDHQGRPVYSRRPLDGAAPLLTVGFRERFPRWELALYRPPGASPRESVRRQLAVFTAGFSVLLVVIAAGVVATYRLVRRETEMARLKSDFVANVSHDLKTPLSVIRMFGETLEMGRVTDEAARQEYYRVITREGERLSRLIDNVLDFSRIEGGRRTYDLVPTAVEPLVRETLDAFSYPLHQQGFAVTVEVAPDLPEAPMDAAAVGQALANLIDNAIKYSGDVKALHLTASLRDGGLALGVADRGIGIPREEHQRIFQKFYRVGRSDTQGRRGSGVGLALVRHVAEAHGGRVTVDSRPGEGSRFTLWLPLGGPCHGS